MQEPEPLTYSQAADLCTAHRERLSRSAPHFNGWADTALELGATALDAYLVDTGRPAGHRETLHRLLARTDLVEHAQALGRGPFHGLELEIRARTSTAGADDLLELIQRPVAAAGITPDPLHHVFVMAHMGMALWLPTTVPRPSQPIWLKRKEGALREAKNAGLDTTTRALAAVLSVRWEARRRQKDLLRALLKSTDVMVPAARAEQFWTPKLFGTQKQKIKGLTLWTPGILECRAYEETALKPIHELASRAFGTRANEGTNLLMTLLYVRRNDFRGENAFAAQQMAALGPGRRAPSGVQLGKSGLRALADGHYELAMAHAHLIATLHPAGMAAATQRILGTPDEGMTDLMRSVLRNDALAPVAGDSLRRPFTGDR